MPDLCPMCWGPMPSEQLEITENAVLYEAVVADLGHDPLREESP